jgi:hypothetical protein
MSALSQCNLLGEKNHEKIGLSTFDPMFMTAFAQEKAIVLEACR